MSARVVDTNGWFEVKRNPLSKVGIYPYSGAQIGAAQADHDKIFRVYRPAEELSAEETIESFKLVPLIDDHTMIGDGFTPAEQKGVAGVIGESVFFENDTLYGNPKIYSSALAEKIKNGKTELSMGYKCRYDFTPGIWNGQPYDVVQRNLRGNHVALVDEGRMGPEVAILDHRMVITVDAKETLPVDEELKAALAAIVARLDKLEAAKPSEDEEAAKKTEDEDAETEKATDEEAVKKVEDEDTEKATDEEETPASMDAALKKIAKLEGRLAAAEKRPAMDEAAMVRATADRGDLVEKLSRHIGTFDHSRMTGAEIAVYGVEKLGIKNVAKGQERVALDAFLQAAPIKDPAKARTVATDGAATGLAASIVKHSTGA